MANNGRQSTAAISDSASPDVMRPVKETKSGEKCEGWTDIMKGRFHWRDFFFF